MKKNLFAIETAVTLILISMLIAGIILKEFVVTWLSVGFLALGGFGILVYKIIYLVKSEVKEQNANQEDSEDKGKVRNLLGNTKKAWQFSSNGERIKSLLFIFTFMLCCIAFIILCSYGLINAGLAVIFGGLGVIILSIIIMAVIEKMLYKKYLNDLAKQESIKLNETTEKSNIIINETTLENNIIIEQNQENENIVDESLTDNITTVESATDDTKTEN